MTAKEFIARLSEHKSDQELDKVRKFFWDDDDQTEAFGVKFGTVFKLAKEFKDMPFDEIEKLLESPYYEVRMGAVSIMDFQARHKKTSTDRKRHCLTSISKDPIESIIGIL